MRYEEIDTKLSDRLPNSLKKCPTEGGEGGCERRCKMRLAHAETPLKSTVETQSSVTLLPLLLHRVTQTTVDSFSV